MSYLDSQTKAYLRAQLQTKVTQLNAANTAYTAALGNAEIESYSFDSGEGKQSTKRRKPEEILTQIRQLEAEIARIHNKLGGRGIVQMDLRRRRWGI